MDTREVVKFLVEKAPRKDIRTDAGLMNYGTCQVQKIKRRRAKNKAAYLSKRAQRKRR